MDPRLSMSSWTILLYKFLSHDFRVPNNLPDCKNSVHPNPGSSSHTLRAPCSSKWGHWDKEMDEQTSQQQIFLLKTTKKSLYLCIQVDHSSSSPAIKIGTTFCAWFSFRTRHCHLAQPTRPVWGIHLPKHLLLSSSAGASIASAGDRDKWTKAEWKTLEVAPDVVTAGSGDTPAACSVTASAWWALLKITQSSPRLIHLLVDGLWWWKQLQFCSIWEFHHIPSQQRACYYLPFVSYHLLRHQAGSASQPSEKKSYFLLLILWLTTCARKFGRQVRQWIRACSSRIFSQQRALSFPQCSFLTYEVEIRSFIQLVSERWPLTSLLEDPGINSSL